MKKITVYAEKPDVAIKIAVALSDDFKHDNKSITMDNVEKYKNSIQRSYTSKGYIPIEYKGDELYITWGKGHMAGLKHAKDYNPDYKNWSVMPMPFIPEKYEIKVRGEYDFKTKKTLDRPDPWAIKQLNIIDDLFKKSDYIINATDFDREGEVIFAYVYEILNCNKPYKRAVIDSFTQDGLIATFDNLKDEDFVKPTEMAGRGRAIADWVVGINLTSLMSLKYGDKDNPLIAIGRVQTPTLNMIVEREKEIQNFKPEPFWRIKAEFAKDEKFEAEHEKERFDKKEEAEEILKKIEGKKGKVLSRSDKSSKRKVPLLYNLTSLSLDANSKFSINASETLAIAQELYSSGYITYPRSSSQHLTDDMKPVVDDVINMLSTMDEYKEYIEPIPQSERNYTSRHFNSKKVDSHYAIIPTNQKPKNLNDKEEKIYDLIAKSLIRIIYKDAELKNTEVQIDVNGERFISKGSVITDPQWMQVDAIPKSMNVLPKLNKGDILDGEYFLHEGKTKPPPRYNDGSLLTAMITAGKHIEDDELRDFLENSEYKGIGRDSTRSSIIETVVRLYCTRKGKQIIPTERAMKLIDILPIDEIKSAEMTADWEMKLDQVEKGNLVLEDFIEEIERQTTIWCKEIEALPTPKKTNPNINIYDKPCPICGNDVLVFDWGYTCKNNKKNDKKCNFYIPKKVSGKTLRKKDVEALFSLKDTEFIRDLKSKNNKIFGAKFRINKETGAFEYVFESEFNCKICGKPMSSNSMFYFCPNKSCNFSVPYIVAQKKLSKQNIDDLLTKGKTNKIDGFISKKGKEFSAKLVMNDENRVEFSFD